MNKAEIKSRIDAWVDAHGEEYIKDVTELVAIRSVKSEARDGMPFGEGSARALEKTCEMFQGYGFRFVNMDNYIAYADINDKESALDILGHVDVVGEGEGWDTDPYVAVVKEDGCIYGRGTDDDKGPVIAALYAMRAVKELGIELSKGVRLIVGADEESGSGEDLDKYYGSFKPAPATFSPDASFPIFNTEKGTFRPEFKKEFEKSDVKKQVVRFDGGFRFNVLPAKAEADIVGFSKSEVDGILAPIAAELGVEYSSKQNGETVTLCVNGRGTHASTPEEGINGIRALLNMLCALELDDCDSTVAIRELSSLFPFGDYYGDALGIKQSDDISGPLTLAFSILKMDRDGLCGNFDSRTPICANEENCKEICEDIFYALGYSFKGEMSLPHHTPADSTFVKTLACAYEDYTGNKCECLYMGGGTYVHDIEGGVAFGAAMPEFQSNLHGANERACVKDMLCAVKIFAKVIIDMCL